MMCSMFAHAASLILLCHVARALPLEETARDTGAAHDSIRSPASKMSEKMADKLVDKLTYNLGSLVDSSNNVLFDRAIIRSPLHYRGLDTTAIGKPSHGVSAERASLLSALHLSLRPRSPRGAQRSSLEGVPRLASLQEPVASGRLFSSAPFVARDRLLPVARGEFPGEIQPGGEILPPERTLTSIKEEALQTLHMGLTVASEAGDVQTSLELFQKVKLATAAFINQAEDVNEVVTYEPQDIKRFVGWREISAICNFNIACCYSKLGAVDLGLEALEDSFKAGMDDWKVAREDDDLELLRQDPRFLALLTRYESESTDEQVPAAVEDQFP